MMTDEQLLSNPKIKYLFENSNRSPFSDWGVESDAGWNEIISNTLEKIAQVDVKKRWSVGQIKEKFGGLRLYMDVDQTTENVPSEEFDKVREFIREAEDLCDKTCERCGNPNDRGPVSINRWVYAVCEDCERNMSK